MKPTPPWSLLTQPEKYTNAADTDIAATFRKHGFKPPSEHKATIVPIKKARS